MSFLKIKTIPELFWSAPIPLSMRPPFASCAMLIFGLIIFGFGETLLIASGSGVSPWTVFAQGISRLTGWSIGLTTFVVSCAVLLLWIPLRQMPGIGTILNIIIVASVMDLALPHIPVFEEPVFKIAEGALGVFTTGFGGAIYLIANLGPGPRDGLMTGAQRITGLPIVWVRSAIEILVVTIGWLLGGIVGIGTLLFAFGIGPSIALSMAILISLFGKKNSH